MSLQDIIKEKFGTQQKCADELGWTKQKLSKIVLKKREARVSEINELANVLNESVEDIIIFLR